MMRVQRNMAGLLAIAEQFAAVGSKPKQRDPRSVETNARRGRRFSLATCPAAVEDHGTRAPCGRPR